MFQTLLLVLVEVLLLLLLLVVMDQILEFMAQHLSPQCGQRVGEVVDMSRIAIPMMGTGATDMAQLRSKGVQCYGIARHSEALRYATERLNDALLSDLSIAFVAFDAAAMVRAGDLIDVTHPEQIELLDK